jgi:hypothetical protein
MSVRLINRPLTASIAATATLLTLLVAPTAAQTPPLTRDVISPPAAANARSLAALAGRARR